MIVTLERHDEESNAHRYYRITVTGCELLREWGRVGAKAKELRKLYESESAALEAGRKIRDQKMRKGYKWAPEQLSFFD